MTRAFAVLAVAVLGVLALGLVSSAGAIPSPPGETDPPAALGATEGKVVEVRTGVATLADLVHTKTVTERHGVYRFSRPVNVLAGATLQLADASVLLSGGVLPATIRVDGTLTLDHVRLSGGNGPRAERPEITVRAGGSLQLDSSDVVGLGATEDHPGIAVRGAGASASIVDSTVSRNYRGLVLTDADRLTMQGSTVADNLDSGVVVNGACATVTIRSTAASQNHADGFAFDTTCTTLDVSGGSADRNGESGIDVGGTTNITISSVHAWGNASGITTHDGAVVTVGDAKLSANQVDGITMNAQAGSLVVARSRIDHNVRAGISVSDGTTTVGPGNVITGNDTGIRLVDGTATVKAAGNTIDRNVRDGFSLSAITGVEISGNRIVANGDAAFSVRQQGDAGSFVAANTVRASPAKERIRSADAAEAS